jgi:hypothetical protein
LRNAKLKIPLTLVLSPTGRGIKGEGESAENTVKIIEPVLFAEREVK